MRASSFMLLLIAYASTANARLGETFEELQARYGNPIKEQSNSTLRILFFEKGDYSVSCYVYDGKTEVIYIKKVCITEKFSEEEVDAFVKKNLGSNYEEHYSPSAENLQEFNEYKSLHGEDDYKNFRTLYDFSNKTYKGLETGFYGKWINKINGGELRFFTEKGKIIIEKLEVLAEEAKEKALEDKLSGF